MLTVSGGPSLAAGCLGTLGGPSGRDGGPRCLCPGVPASLCLPVRPSARALALRWAGLGWAPRCCGRILPSLAPAVDLGTRRASHLPCAPRPASCWNCRGPGREGQDPPAPPFACQAGDRCILGLCLVLGRGGVCRPESKYSCPTHPTTLADFLPLNLALQAWS